MESNESVINQTIAFVKQQLQSDSTGHDWWHVNRVWKMAVTLAEEERANLLVVQLAALLHDIADWKFHDGDDKKGEIVACEWLQSLHMENTIIIHVCEIIRDISFKGAGVNTKMETLEGKVVQDADRLDALGAIGIARAFAYGGNKEREMYNPDIEPVFHQSFEQYKKSKGTTINHFYEKLFLLKGLMNTDSGRRIAEEREQFMKEFINKFLAEWNGFSLP
jgi:uncharacterized protein